MEPSTQTQAPATPVANLRETRKEMAAAKRRHPAGSQTPAKAPAKKAAAKKATPKAGTSLRWQYDKETKMTTGQTAVIGDREYAIKPDGDKWKATVKQGGKTTVLATGSFGAAYNACTKHNKEQGAAA